jgi:hypothetical protein
MGVELIAQRERYRSENALTLALPQNWSRS